ncbi:methyltransferase family protein [Anaerobacterium chartisolvens]|uniref:Methyltransferase family protein n=1 Tax=Anaerobacterium chartisolvens TaxID=1297424 RepID=A0A369BEA0_9FIRM|nr:class I SAM-dependent methyltransferase [Anaerobacterium chartisolvens]RCX18916.1 methyltransferase family protein [Anaerobacterium chartisolvens]
MESTFFEELLKGKNQRGVSAEAFWDGRAEQFNSNVQKGGGGQVEALISVLKANKLLKAGDSVLDIGCGTGRYTVEFAKVAGEVTGIDVSSKMLEYAAENSSRENVKNTRYIKLDWGTADFKELGWEKSFDLVFASMCPGIDSRRALEKMSEVSRGHCFISRTIQRKDSIADALSEHFGIERKYDPHNDRDKVCAMFNLLWMSGYSPEITYLNMKQDIELTAEEAMGHHGWALEAGVREDEMKAFLLEKQGDKVIKGVVCSSTALIYWKV